MLQWFISHAGTLVKRCWFSSLVIFEAFVKVSFVFDSIILKVFLFWSTLLMGQRYKIVQPRNHESIELFNTVIILNAFHLSQCSCAVSLKILFFFSKWTWPQTYIFLCSECMFTLLYAGMCVFVCVSISLYVCVLLCGHSYRSELLLIIDRRSTAHVLAESVAKQEL